MNPIAEILDEMEAYTALADKFPSRFAMHAKRDVPKLVAALRVAMEWVKEEDEIRYIQAILSKP